MAGLTEAQVEVVTLDWFAGLGYAVAHGPDLAPDQPVAERSTFGDVILAERLRAAIARLNPRIPDDAREEALRKVLRIATPSLIQTNRAFHRLLREGVEVEYPRGDGSISGDHVRLVDFADVDANDWLAVNQFTVNRVFRDKPGGLVVDYLGLADQLKQALATYTQSGGKGSPTFDAEQAVEVMLEKYGIVRDMFHGFDWSNWTTGTPAERLSLIPAGQEHILEQKDGQTRFVQIVGELSRAFALSAASDEATEIREDVAFFQTIQAALNKKTTGNRKTPEQLDAAIRQLVSKALTTEGQVIDVFTAAGLPRPDISILSDEFLAEVRGLKHKNVAAELLAKLLKDEIKSRSKRNVVQSQLFSEKLQQTLNAYHNRAIATHEIIEEMIRLAKEMQAATLRGEQLGLTDDEIAFYDALATNESAIQAMGDDKLKLIAAELIQTIRKSVTIDWQYREGARAKIRVVVKRILNKYGYPPDLQEEAVQTVLRQAEAICGELGE